MAQNADLPISCKNFSGVTTPNPRHVLHYLATALRWLAQLIPGRAVRELHNEFLCMGSLERNK